MKPSCSKLKEFIKDEKSGAKTYSKYRLPKLAKDERQHAIILNKMLRKC